MGTNSKGQERAMQQDGTESRWARLRFLSVAVPLAGLAVLYLVRLALRQVWPVVAVDTALGLLTTVGALSFSWAIAARARIDGAIDRLGELIKDMRRYILIFWACGWPMSRLTRCRKRRPRPRVAPPYPSKGTQFNKAFTCS
jgi:hypothetical protein